LLSADEAASVMSKRLTELQGQRDAPADLNVTSLNRDFLNHGLLRESAGQTGFFHQAVQEYFFAREVALHQSMEYVLKHVNDPTWTEILVFVCGLIDDATEVVREVIKDNPYLAAKATTYARHIEKETIEKLALCLIDNLKGKFEIDIWYGKFYHEMLALLSIEPKLHTTKLSDLFLITYENSPQALHDFSRLLIAMDIPEKAITFLEPLVEANADDIVLRNMLATAYRNVGRFKDSISHFKKCMELDPDNFLALVAWGITYELMKDFDKAESCFRQALEFDEKSNWAHYHLGIALLAKKNYDEAMEKFQEAIRRDWRYGGPHTGLADLYLDYVKEPEKAIHECEIALQLEKRPSRFRRPMFSLARALEAANRTIEARYHYQKYLDQFPWGEHAQEALAALERLGAA
jgi:tetratricopeptide (TPR) repeat protein